MRKRIILLIYLLAVLVLCASAVVKAASEFELEFLPPCPANGDCQSVSGQSIAEYIVRFYQFGVGFAGILAVGMIAAGAIYKSINPGNPGKQKEGEDMMKSAIWGIILLLGSYLILRTINPTLVQLSEPVLEEIPAQEFGAFVLIPDEQERAQYLSSTSTGFTDLSDYCARNYGELRPDCMSANVQQCVPGLGGSCVRLNSSLPMKPNQCRWRQSSGVSSECWVQPQTNEALRSLNAMLSGIYNVNAFYITEAFPPTAQHASAGHYTGCSVDIAVVPQPEGRCETVSRIMDVARQAGFSPHNEYSECQGQPSERSTGGHIHLTMPNCP